MGVHDFRCSVCGSPGSYKCGEKTGTQCVRAGIGEDKAVLDLFFFDADGAPEDPSEFEGAREQARRVKTQKFEYDWGDARGKVEKAPFIEKVRERVARRLPAEK